MIDLINVVKTYSSLCSFVEDGQLAIALNAIGGVHLKAARYVLDEIHYTSNSREAVNRVLTHLEAAHIAFRDLWESDSLTGQYHRLIDSLKDTRVCCLIAVCYKFLGNEQRLVSRALDNAEQALNVYFYETDNKDRILLRIVNPFGYIDAVRHKYDYDEKKVENKSLRI